MEFQKLTPADIAGLNKKPKTIQVILNYLSKNFYMILNAFANKYEQKV